MNSFAKAWDFVWGALLVGMLPLFALFLVGSLGSYVRPAIDGGWSHRYLFSLSLAADVVAPLVTFYYVGHWRQKHRLLPASWFKFEILFGWLLAIAAFIFMCICWDFASLD